jgi:hypothetical protein
MIVRRSTAPYWPELTQKATSHNPEVAGSNPAPATEKDPETGLFCSRRSDRPAELWLTFAFTGERRPAQPCAHAGPVSVSRPPRAQRPTARREQRASAKPTRTRPSQERRGHRPAVRPSAVPLGQCSQPSSAVKSRSLQLTTSSVAARNRVRPYLHRHVCGSRSRSARDGGTSRRTRKGLLSQPRSRPWCRRTTLGRSMERERSSSRRPRMALDDEFVLDRPQIDDASAHRAFALDPDAAPFFGCTVEQARAAHWGHASLLVGKNASPVSGDGAFAFPISKPILSRAVGRQWRRGRVYFQPFSLAAPDSRPYRLDGRFHPRARASTEKGQSPIFSFLAAANAEGDSCRTFGSSTSTGRRRIGPEIRFDRTMQPRQHSV